MPKRTDVSSMLVIGAGSVVIGQACEFDYSGTHVSCKAVRAPGFFGRAVLGADRGRVTLSLVAP